MAYRLSLSLLLLASHAKKKDTDRLGPSPFIPFRFHVVKSLCKRLGLGFANKPESCYSESGESLPSIIPCWIVHRVFFFLSVGFSFRYFVEYIFIDWAWGQSILTKAGSKVCWKAKL